MRRPKRWIEDAFRVETARTGNALPLLRPRDATRRRFLSGTAGRVRCLSRDGEVASRIGFVDFPDHAHARASAYGARRPCWGGRLVGIFGCSGCLYDAVTRLSTSGLVPAQLEFDLAGSRAEESVVANSHEAKRYHVQQESADELADSKRHDLGTVVIGIVLPGERDMRIGERHNAAIGDGDTMCIAPEVFDNRCGAAERRLRIHHPVGTIESIDEGIQPRRVVFEPLQRAAQRHRAVGQRLLERIEQLAAEEFCHDLDGKQEPGILALHPQIVIQNTARHDAVHVWMRHEILTPGV